jgi:hypothetical protein
VEDERLIGLWDRSSVTPKAPKVSGWLPAFPSGRRIAAIADATVEQISATLISVRDHERS